MFRVTHHEDPVVHLPPEAPAGEPPHELWSPHLLQQQRGAAKDSTLEGSNAIGEERRSIAMMWVCTLCEGMIVPQSAGVPAGTPRRSSS